MLATREGVRVYSGVCPHLAGPLLRARVEAEAAGVLRIVCPWHRYAFDAADGRCLTRPGGPWRGLAAARPAAADLRLTPLPFEVEDECVRVLAGRR